MDNTQKILIALIVILGAVLVVSNIGRFTGQVQLQGAGAGAGEYVPEEVPSTTEISVSPVSVKPGDVLTIEVKVGSQGSDGKVGIYSPDARVAELQLRGCGDTCTPSTDRIETATYKVGLDWKAGAYHVAVVDKGSNEEVKADLTVE